MGLPDTSKPVVQFNRALQLAYCAPCQTFVKLEKDCISKHLRGVHGQTGNMPKQVERRIRDEYGKSKPLMENEEDWRMAYIKYYDENQKQASVMVNEILPPIAGLAIVQAFQCQTCFFINHSQAKVNTNCKKCVGPVHAVSAQTLFTGKTCRLYRVPHTTAGCDWLDDKLDGYEINRKTSVSVQDSKGLDSFVSVLRIDTHLQSQNITMEDAFNLCCWEGDRDVSSRMYTSLRLYVEKASVLFKQNMFIKTKKFLGSDIHLDIMPDSKNRYVKHVTSLFYFLTNWKQVEDGCLSLIHI